jgi:hypothetical protein
MLYSAEESRVSSKLGLAGKSLAKPILAKKQFACPLRLNLTSF